jgi:hypothetical protein
MIMVLSIINLVLTFSANRKAAAEEEARQAEIAKKEAETQKLAEKKKAAEKKKEITIENTDKENNVFELSNVLEGTGKIKFGYGVYFTSSYKSAAHYSAVDGVKHYVYTVKIPKLTENNFIAFKQKVPQHLIESAQVLTGKPLTNKIISDGKGFRKYMVKFFDNKNLLNGEKLTSQWLSNQGIDYIIWPYNWKIGYTGETNRCLLDVNKIIITQIDEISLDEKKQLKEIIQTNIKF